MPILDDNNFYFYCAQNYRNPACTGVEEFNSDIRRIKYVKKLLTRFSSTGDLKERLILNHIIILANMFDPVSLNRILFLKMEPQFPMIKPFLLGLNILQDRIINVKEERIVNTEIIPMDQTVVNAIRPIFAANK